MNIKTVIENHELWLKTRHSKGERADLRNANLQEADLRNANLQEANLQNADLQYANLQGANLQFANLQDANLRNVDLQYANCNFHGKNVYLFKFQMHTAIAIDGYIQIGCQYQDTETWLKNYKKIGKAAGYTEEQINAYGTFIKMVANSEE